MISQQFNPEIGNIFNNVNVDLQGMLLLEQEGKDNLIDFANTGIGDIDFQAYLTEVNHTLPQTLTAGTTTHHTLIRIV